MTRADTISMDSSRKNICPCLALAALLLGAFSGCATEAPRGSAAAHAGLIGEFYEEIESEDDESEARQRAALREGGPQALEPGQHQIEVEGQKRELEAEEQQEWQ